MIESMTARWLLTAVFVAAALCAGLVRRSDRPAAAFCAAMCAAMIAMAWRTESAVATWVQVGGFGCAALWFVLAGRTSSDRSGRPALTDLHHALMAAAMVWMLTVLVRATSLPRPVLAVTSLCAVYCAVAAIPWLARAVGPGLRVTDPAAAGQAMMSAGMAVMLVAML